MNIQLMPTGSSESVYIHIVLTSGVLLKQDEFGRYPISKKMSV